MSMDRLFSIIGGLVGVAMVATLVSSRNTAGVVTAIGNAGSGLFRAAQGR